MTGQPTIPILPAAGAASTACGGCLASRTNAALCQASQASQARPAAATVLEGPRDELRRLLVALGRQLGFAPESPEQAGLLALRLAPGEVELRLATPAHCTGEGATQAETAFQTLRSLLPDTDIYVTHAA